MALTDNLVSYWKLDESSGNAADSLGGNTLVNTSVTYGTGQINNAALYAANGELRIANASQVGLNISGDMSVSAWVKFNNFAASGRYMGILQMGAAVGIKNTGTQEVPIVRSTASNVVGSATGISVGVWYHMVFVNATNNWTFYLNAGTGNTIGTNNNWNAANDVVMGGNINLVAGTVTQFDGAIDEVGVWSRALTTLEVANLYNSGIGIQYPFVLGGGTLNLMGV